MTWPGRDLPSGEGSVWRVRVGDVIQTTWIGVPPRNVGWLDQVYRDARLRCCNPGSWVGCVAFAAPSEEPTAADKIPGPERRKSSALVISETPKTKATLRIRHVPAPQKEEAHCHLRRALTKFPPDPRERPGLPSVDPALEDLPFYFSTSVSARRDGGECCGWGGARSRVSKRRRSRVIAPKDYIMV